ncbi:MAG TPA: long-chain fatty acid--CoA ligase [Sphingomonadaceae bacterium]
MTGGEDVPAAHHPAPDHYKHPCPWELDLPPLTMPGMLARSVAAHPAASLVEFMGRRFSYAEIETEARAFAAGLQRWGIAKGDRVGLFLPNLPVYVAAYYGAMMAGATAVNFSPLYTEDELNHQVADSGTRLLVTVAVPGLLPIAAKVLADSALEQLVVADLGDMLPWGKRLALRLFGRGKTAAIPRRKDVTAWRKFLDGAAFKPVALDPERDLALIQYTGGTTGTPKGAMLTHQNLTANARQTDAVDPFREQPDVIMAVLPLFHVFANTCTLNRTVAKGGCLAMLPQFHADEALKTLERVKATAFPGVPTMYQALLDDPRIARTDFSSLLVCVSGGAPLPAPLREKFEAATGAHLVEGYGLTESSGVVSTNPYAGESRAGTIGQPLPETEVRLLDKDDPANDAPAGEPGELAVRGPQVMQGYWKRPDAEATAFAMREGNRWLRTGDIATFDADGYIRIVDRSKDMINVGGFKVFPSQVEEVLLRHPAIREAAVIAVPDSYLGERPVAFVSLNPAASPAPGEDELLGWANEHLGKHERLKAVMIRTDLPKTLVGKLDKKALRAQLPQSG